MDNDHAELGYSFHAYPAGASLGYTGLDVFLAAAGADGGFAPSQLSVAAWTENGDVSMTRLVLTVHWAGPDTIHVAPGIVTILSYGGGEQTAYCFGGVLTCQRAANYLHCQFSSSAPILNIGEEGMDWSENVVLRVVDGIESEIATCRAHTNGQGRETCDARLARTDPRLLYAVGLALAQRSLAVLPDLLRTEHYWEEYNVLMRALHEAEQEEWWPSDPAMAAVLPALMH